MTELLRAHIITATGREDSRSEMRVWADHNNNVHFNPDRTAALVRLGGSGSARSSGEKVLSVRYIAKGSNSLLDPPRLAIGALGGTEVVVTIESLLYAIKTMHDTAEPGPQPA